MDIGFIKLNRRILKWEWYDDDKTFKLFLHLLLTVNWEEKKWHGLAVKPGQLVTSYPNLAQQTNNTPQSLRTALGKLKATGEITVQTTNRYSLISIVKWEDYQEKTTSKTTRQSTDKQQSSNIQATPTKEDKELKEVKNILKDRAKTPDPGISLLVDFLSEQLKGSLDESQKTNRQYCHLLLNRIKKDFPDKDPIKGVQALIMVGLRDKFHAKNVTNFKYLFYNAQKIAQSFRGDTNKVILR